MIPAKMTAVRVHEFGGPEVLRIEQVHTPETKPGTLLIRIEAVGINPVETYVRSGSNPSLARPYTPGSDAAGTVVAVGQGIGAEWLDRKIYTSGTLTGAYAQFALVTLEQAHELPAGFDAAMGAAVHVPYFTAYRALFQRAQTKPGETILIHGGSGGVGIAAIQLARWAGLRVVATAGTDQGRALILQQGADLALDHHAADIQERLMQFTQGRGVDVILEMLSNVNLGRDLKWLANRGRVVVIGSRGSVEINPRDAMTRDADILGLFLFNATPAERAEIVRGLKAAFESGKVRPVIGKRFPLAEAVQAHAAIMSPGALGKIILETGA